MLNRHRQSRNIRNTYDSFGSGTKLLFTFLSLRFFDTWRERQNFFLCWLFHQTPPHVAHFVDPNWSHRGEAKNWLPSSRLESQLSRSEFKSELTVFFKFQNPQPTLPGMTSFTSPVLFPIWGFYCDISHCHTRPACAWTPALHVCT